MGAWQDLLDNLMGKEYAPGLPENAPKPPGYWATQQLREGPVNALGILPGMVGSAYDAYTENIPMRIGSIIGQATSTVLPQGVTQAMRDTPALGEGLPIGPTAIPFAFARRMLGGLAEGARKVNPPAWGDPEVFKQGTKHMGPIEQFAATSMLDPANLAFGAEAATRLATSFPKFAPAIRATMKGAQTLQDVQAIPFMAIGKYGTKAVKAVGEGYKRIPHILTALNLEQAPQSAATQLIKHMEDAIENTPSYFSALRYPLEGMRPFSGMPTMRSGAPNITLANSMISRRYTGLENRILDPQSIPNTIHNMQVWLAAQHARSNIHAGLMDDLARDLNGPNPMDREDAVQAYNAWWDRSNRLLDDLQSAFKHGGVENFPNQPGIVPAGNVGPAIPTDPTQLQQFVRKTVDTAHSKVRDARQMVDALRHPAMGPVLPADIRGAMVNDIYSKRNREISDAVRTGIGDISRHFGTPTSTTSSDEFVQRLQNLELAAVGGPLGAGYLPDNQREAFRVLGPLFHTEVTKIQGAQQNVLRNIGKSLGIIDTTTPAGAATGKEVWDKLNMTLQVAGLPPLKPLGVATAQETADALGALGGPGLADPQAALKAVNILAQWNERGDILTTDALHLALGKTKARYETLLTGSGALSRLPEYVKSIGKGFSTLRQMEREGWLANPAFPLTNGISALLMNLTDSPKAAIDGYNNIRQMMRTYHYGLTAPGNLTQLAFLPPDVGTKLGQLGLKAAPADFKVAGYIGNNLQGMNGVKSAFETVPWYARAALGAAIAPVDPIGATAQIAFHIKGMPALVRTVQNVSQIIESGARMGLGMQYTERELASQYTNYMQWLKNYLRQGSPTGNLRLTAMLGGTSVMPINNRAGTNIINDIEALARTRNGAFMSPEDILGILQKYNTPIDDMMNITRQWSNAVEASIGVGTAAANKLHVDYGNFTNLEHTIDKLVPFTRWAIRMIPNFRDIMVQSPGVAIALQRMNTITKREAEEMGLPPRYQHMIDAGGLGNGLAQLVVGGPGGRTFVDPARVIMPWQQYIGGADNVQFAEGPVESLFSLLPFRPYPDIQLPLQVASGVLGGAAPSLQPLLPYRAETPLPSISRTSGLAGILGGSSEEAWQTIAKLLPGMQPYDYREAEIQKRIGENAAQETGIPDNPQYLAARATKKGPIYNKAASEASQERGVEQLFGMTLPSGVQVVRNTELAAEEAKTYLPTGRRDTPEKQQAYDKLLREHPWAAAHQGVQGGDFNTRVQYMFNVFRNPTVLFPEAHPSVAQHLAQQLSRYDVADDKTRKVMKERDPLIGVALQRQHQFATELPEAKAYLYWRQQVHPEQRGTDEASLMQQFVDWYMNGGRPPQTWQY